MNGPARSRYAGQKPLLLEWSLDLKLICALYKAKELFVLVVSPWVVRGYRYVNGVGRGMAVIGRHRRFRGSDYNISDTSFEGPFKYNLI